MCIRDRSKILREEETAKESKLRELIEQRLALHKQVPNLTHPDSPDGFTDEDNVPIREVGSKREFDFEPKDHVELMETLDLIDFEGGAKVSGQKFYYLKNQAVFLELALAQYAMSLLQKEGFTVHITPDLARHQILDGIGFNPRGAETQIYSVEESDLCLIATAEITLGGLLIDQLLKYEQLPILYAGLSHCYRTEAGAAGRESRGLYRVHQFSKIEMFGVSDSIGLVMEGNINRKDKSLNFEGEISPIHLINMLLKKVPIIGDLLIGEEGEGLFAFEFEMKGDSSDPEVTSNPLSIAKPQILERASEYLETIE